MDLTKKCPRCGYSAAGEVRSTAAADADSSTASTETAQAAPDRTRRLWLAALAIALVIGVPSLIGISASHDAAVACKGGIDKMDPFGPDYRSDDGVHWTATYPCYNGGSKTIPVRRSEVPGGGR